MVKREQVLELVLKAKSIKQMSEELKLSEAAIKYHIGKILKHYGVTRRDQVIIEHTFAKRGYY